MVGQFANIWGSMIPTVTNFAQNVSKRPILKLLKFYDHLIIISEVIPRVKYVHGQKLLTYFQSCPSRKPRFPQNIIFNNISGDRDK